MDSSVCREQVSRMLAEETRALADLEQVLTVEYEALLTKNVDTLEETAETRRSRIGALVRIEDERRNLCRAMGHEADQAGLVKLMKWCDPARTLASLWDERGARATRCRELNDRNGALVTARLKRVESLVGLLTGQDNRPTTYNPRGNAYSAGDKSGKLFNAEA